MIHELNNLRHYEEALRKLDETIAAYRRQRTVDFEVGLESEIKRFFGSAREHLQGLQPVSTTSSAPALAQENEKVGASAPVGTTAAPFAAAGKISPKPKAPSKKPAQPSVATSAMTTPAKISSLSLAILALFGKGEKLSSPVIYQRLRAAGVLKTASNKNAQNCLSNLKKNEYLAWAVPPEGQNPATYMLGPNFDSLIAPAG